MHLASPSRTAVQSIEAADSTAPRPALLPAFVPLSSSPGGLPRVTKRKFDEPRESCKYYPTPLPTSSTDLLPSSPPRRTTRPGLHRTVSTLSERAPLGDVPKLVLAANGEPLLMGRSSNSSNYQLSAHRHISRVHVRASYHAPDELYPNGKVEVECLGWNGARVHCRREVKELAKGDVFTSEYSNSHILLDVQDTRVMLEWPRDESRDFSSVDEGLTWPEEVSPRPAVLNIASFASSPPLMPTARHATPPSPSPLVASVTDTFKTTFHDDVVQVYEDHSSDEDAPHDPTPEPLTQASPTPKQSFEAAKTSLKRSFAALSSEAEEFSEHDEENDPIVHSFGLFGANLTSRMESFTSGSPEPKRKLQKTNSLSPLQTQPAPKLNLSPVRNHVINQLAFSRVHSLPLSTIHSNLPAELRATLKTSGANKEDSTTSSHLKTILDVIPCVGEISREGKDAAGKLLESEFYYVPEMDTDANRRDTVTNSLGKTSIRAARKQHKQYYWKRPRF